MRESNISFVYGKEGEKIIASLFKEMGFQVTRIGVEHRANFKEIYSKDIYSPDLMLYDKDEDKKFYIEVKTPIINDDNKFVIKKKLFLNYLKYYPKNSFLLLYLPEDNMVGMRNISGLSWYKKWDVAKHKGEELVSFDHDMFRHICYYGNKQVYSKKFSWNTESLGVFDDKLDFFLSFRKGQILKYLEEFKQVNKHRRDWKEHTLKFQEVIKKPEERFYKLHKK